MSNLFNTVTVKEVRLTLHNWSRCRSRFVGDMNAIARWVWHRNALRPSTSMIWKHVDRSLVLLRKIQRLSPRCVADLLITFCRRCCCRILLCKLDIDDISIGIPNESGIAFRNFLIVAVLGLRRSLCRCRRFRLLPLLVRERCHWQSLQSTAHLRVGSVHETQSFIAGGRGRCDQLCAVKEVQDARAHF